MTHNQNPWQDNPLGNPPQTPSAPANTAPVVDTQPQETVDPPAETIVQKVPYAPANTAPMADSSFQTPTQPTPQDGGVLVFFKHHVRTAIQSVWLYLLSSNLLAFLFSIIFSVFLQAYAVWASTHLTNAEWSQFMTTWYSVFEYTITILGTLTATLLTIWFAKARSKIKLRSLFSGALPSFGFLMACIPIPMLCNLAGGLVSQWIAFLLSFFGIYPSSANEIPFESMPGTILFIVLACIVVPILEELMFRGVLLRILGRYSMAMAAVVTSLLFALMHGTWLSIPATFLAGLFLALVTFRTGNLKLAILLHMINNTITVLQSFIMELVAPTSLLYLGFVLCFNVLLPMLGIVSLIVIRRKLRFVCEDPNKAVYCNILTVERPFVNLFKNGWVITLLVALFAQSVVYTIFM